MSRLQRYRALATPRVVGLMSGTSADGIDAALVEVDASPGAARPLRLLRFATLEYPADVRDGLFGLFEDRLSVRAAARLHSRLGVLFGEAALKVLEGEQADLVASHGQTVAHLPDAQPPVTLQLGEASWIAEATGALVVSDFRPADMALGGQAAPLVPFFDARLLGGSGIDRVAINLGGMANLSWIPREGVTLGWDSGPGNVLLDALAERELGQPADLDGALAARGVVREALLAEMLSHPYFQAAAGPRSTGREAFGRNWLDRFVGRCSPADLMRTLCALTAEALTLSLRGVVSGAFEAVVGGGGYRNPVLMAELHQRLLPLGLTRSCGFDEFGITAESRECCAFALMGHETLWERPSSLPAVTGASRPAVLGRITFPSRG